MWSECDVTEQIIFSGLSFSRPSIVMTTVSNLMRSRLIEMIGDFVCGRNLRARTSMTSTFRVVEPSKKIAENRYLRKRCFSLIPEHPNWKNQAKKIKRRCRSETVVVIIETRGVCHRNREIFTSNNPCVICDVWKVSRIRHVYTLLSG